ncbi:hypothetical protein EJ06DRAFT_344954 [Trichodelitschia bisporula]|uniref:Heterokaryon incompatibility domain-containing protein n=1 Tax=Trichodelitschia bisporula TaxID=703511 RepID=A0A6G1I3I9_9PEZI|nr:hypothetical protein EJ06DRAFT_344954 [Trichodelitschia bisporula]
MKLSLPVRQLMSRLKNAKEHEERTVENGYRGPSYLCEAIEATERVVKLLSTKDPERRGRLVALSNLLWQRSRCSSGILDDLNQAITRMEDALTLHPQISMLKGPDLERLSALYEDRFERENIRPDQEKAIALLEQAVHVTHSKWRIQAAIVCLWLRLRETRATVVLEVPFDDISSAPISHADVPLGRFRFIDTAAFAERSALRVIEFEHLPKDRYVALSYVWRGVPVSPEAIAETKTMSIDGATDADPISIEVLRKACLAALKERCPLLWLDGVCIIQASAEDRAWQIRRMYDLYAACKTCLVVPGGLAALVSLTTETPWLHRAWTLQEALAPPRSATLFAWDHGPHHVISAHFPVFITYLEDGAAMADTKSLTDMSILGRVRFSHIEKQHDRDAATPITLRLLGSAEHDQAPLMALAGAREFKRKDEGFANAVWRAALLRCASHPVDMIFSIMGLLRVTLDPSKYPSEDVVPALIDLMQVLLNRGDKAEWLGVAPGMAVGNEISMLPVLPKVMENGRAGVLIDSVMKDAAITMGESGDTWWKLKGAPTGAMDAEGVLTFEALAVAVRLMEGEAGEGKSFKDVKDRTWAIDHKAGTPPFAVFVGKKERYSNAALGMMIDPWDSLVMLVDEKEKARLRVLGQSLADKAASLTIGKGVMDKAASFKPKFAAGRGHDLLAKGTGMLRSTGLLDKTGLLGSSDLMHTIGYACVKPEVHQAPEWPIRALRVK